MAIVSPKTTESLLDPVFMRKLERLALAVKKVRSGVAKGERRSTRKGASTDFADFRDYVQGDDLRHVDWNIYGRLEHLYLKLFEEYQDLTLHLLIDASASMNFGSPTKIHFARQFAAALGYVALSGHERVCVEAFAGDRVQRLASCRGKGSVRKLFTFLDGIQADGGTHLEGASKSYMSRNASKGIAILISDFFDEEGFEGAIRRLNAGRSDVYAIHVLAPEEIDPQLTGDLKLIDSETGAFAEVSMSRALLKSYGRNLDGFIEQVRSYCVARGVGYVPVSSDITFERLTLDMLRKGGLLR